MTKPSPINPTTPAAREIACDLLTQTRFGALAVTHDHAPYVARVALLAEAPDLITLVSTLAVHTQALLHNPACAVLIGEPGGKGDPLTHPRMTMICRAERIDKATQRDRWLGAIPKAQLYYDFADFIMFRLATRQVHLNGGFGKAFHLTPSDLRDA